MIKGRVLAQGFRMRFKNRMFLGSFMLLCSAQINAGTMGHQSADFTGFLAGVGGGYVNTNISKSTDVTMFSTFAPVTQYYREDNIKNSFSPIANASYFKTLDNVEEPGWLWGIKGLYKYLGMEHPRITWSGTFQNGTYQEASFHTIAVQELFLTLNAGYQIFDSWLVYLGVGPSVTEVKNQLRGGLLESTSTTFQYTDRTRSKALWGVAGQVGFEYMLPHRFMLDLSYNLVVSPKGTMPKSYLYTGSSNVYTAFSQRVQLLEQGLNVTVNKYFG